VKVLGTLRENLVFIVAGDIRSP